MCPNVAFAKQEPPLFFLQKKVKTIGIDSLSDWLNVEDTKRHRGGHEEVVREFGVELSTNKFHVYLTLIITFRRMRSQDNLCILVAVAASQLVATNAAEYHTTAGLTSMSPSPMTPQK